MLSSVSRCLEALLIKKALALVFDILRRFQVYTTQNTTEMIRAFLQVNGRFQVYTTQDTTGMIRAFLQVNGRFQVYTTQDTTGMSRAFLQVNCRFQVYTTQDTTAMIRAFLQVNVDFRYTLPRLILCNADNKSSGNKGTQHDPARSIVCEIF